MLINDAILILSNARLALGDLGHEIAENIEAGLNNTEEQEELRRRLVLTYGILKTLDPIIVIGDDDEIEYILDGYADEKINRMLLFLKDISRAGKRPVLSLILNPVVTDVNSGGQQGQQGNAGASAYVYIGYADDISGTGYSPSATGKDFIAFKNSLAPISPVTAGTFTGLWRKFTGDTGENGNDGADGQDVYIYRGYADDGSGTGFTTTFNASKKWIAIRTSTTVLTPVVGDFAGLWIKYVGDDGDAGQDGADGNTIHHGSGAPSGALGVDGDFYKDTASNLFYGPKALGNWGTPTDLKGDTGDTGNDGNDGADGNDGTDSFLYIAYADGADGTGFTMTFDPLKNYIAFLPTTSEIVDPVVGDFAGLWRKYRGEGGDTYATSSATSLTIGTGFQYLIVGLNLSYTTGQRFVIALNGDPTNRMEGVVVNYDAATGQFTGDVDTVFGSGTYGAWDVNLAGAPTTIASQNAYYGILGTDQGSGGSTQALSTSPVKINAFDTIVSQSAGMAVSTSTDDITPDNNGAYVVDFNATVSGPVSVGVIFQLYRDGVAEPNAIARVLFDGSGNPQNLTIHTLLQDVQQAEVFDIRATAASGTPNLLVEQGRLAMYTVGYINSEQYKDFENADIDIGTETVDSFSASLGNAAKFEYVVIKGVNFRSGSIFAVWDGTNQPEESETGTTDIGSTSDLDLDVDFSGGDIRLRATAASNDWIVRGKRTIIG